MPVFHDIKSIFVHINKCGGSTIEELFFPTQHRKMENLWGGIQTDGFNKYGEPGGLQHLSVASIKKALGDKMFNEYFKFTFVRDPWRRAVSQYCYTKGRIDIQEWIGVKGDFSFLQYLKGISSCKCHVQFRPQHEFIYKNGELLVDFMGRLENIQEDLKKICKVLNISPPPSIPHANSRLPRDYKLFYGAEEESLVLEKYREDFKLLNYPSFLPKCHA